MSGDDIETVSLSATELAAVARRLMARHAQNWDTTIEWGDVPMLSESAFDWLHTYFGVLAREQSAASDCYDRDHDIDSAALIERLQ